MTDHFSCMENKNITDVETIRNIIWELTLNGWPEEYNQWLKNFVLYEDKFTFPRILNLRYLSLSTITEIWIFQEKKFTF